MPPSSSSHSDRKSRSPSQKRVQKQKEGAIKKSKTPERDRRRKQSRSSTPKRNKERAERTQQQNKKLFITNIEGKFSQDQVREDLKKQFGVYGTIKQIVVKTRVNSSNTYAFIQYEQLQPASKAVEGMKGKIFKGKELKVQFGRAERKQADRQGGGCYYCHKDGHFARQCRQKNRDSRNDRYGRRRSRSRSERRRYRRSYSRSSSQRDKYRSRRRRSKSRSKSYSPVYRRHRQGRQGRDGRDGRDNRDNRDNGRDGGREKRKRSPVNDY